MDNTWYYTLSTIVQALASIFGLGGTFLVFKLQTLERELREYRNKATRVLMYLEHKEEPDYDPLSLVDLSKVFLLRITDFIAKKGSDFRLQDYDNLRTLWGLSGEHPVFPYELDDKAKERFHFFIKQRAHEFDSKVQYRLKLYWWALGTGLLLAFSMIVALGMLAGFTQTFMDFWHISTRASVSIITILAFIGIGAVMYTAFYAIWGDKY